MGEDTAGQPSGNPSRRRASVDEAARTLGLSVDAVRKRVQRGTIPHEKDAAGRVRIILDSLDNTSTVQDESPDTTGQRPGETTPLLEAKDETIEELRERVRSLERQLDSRQEEIRRRDHLLAAALERIPEIEAPQERRESPQERAEASGGAEDRSASEGQETGTRRPWWRRVFGG